MNTSAISPVTVTPPARPAPYVSPLPTANVSVSAVPDFAGTANLGTLVDVSPLAQVFSTALNLLASQLVNKTDTVASGNKVASNFTELAIAANLFVNAFNNFQASNADLAENPLSSNYGSELTQAINIQILPETGKNLIDSLAQIGIHLQTVDLNGSNTQLSLNPEGLQAAYTSDPGVTANLLAQALQALAEVESRILQQNQQAANFADSGIITPIPADSATDITAEISTNITGNAATNTTDGSQTASISNSSNAASAVTTQAGQDLASQNSNATTGTIASADTALQNVLADEALAEAIRSNPLSADSNNVASKADNLSPANAANIDNANKLENTRAFASQPPSEQTSLSTSSAATANTDQAGTTESNTSGLLARKYGVAVADNVFTASTAADNIADQTQSLTAADQLSSSTQASFANNLLTSISDSNASAINTANTRATETSTSAQLNQLNANTAATATNTNNAATAGNAAANSATTNSQVNTANTTISAPTTNAASNQEATDVSQASATSQTRTASTTIVIPGTTTTATTTVETNNAGATATAQSGLPPGALNPALSAAVAAYKVGDSSNHDNSEKPRKENTDSVNDVEAVDAIAAIQLNPHEHSGQENQNQDSEAGNPGNQPAARATDGKLDEVENIDTLA